MNLRAQKILELNKIIERVAAHAQCSETKEMISKMRPSSSKEIVNRWLDETKSAYVYLIRRGSLPISQVKSCTKAVHIASIGGIIYNKELLQIRDLLYATRRMKNHIEDTKKLADDQDSLIINLVKSLYTNERLEKEIGRIVVSEDDIADDASKELKRIRRGIRNEQEKIKDKVSNLIKSKTFSKYLQDVVVTMREDRYVIPVKAEYKGYVKGLVHDTSSSGQTYFIEPMVALEGNNRVNELKKEEAREVERILRVLSNQIAEVADEINRTEPIIFKLDFLFSKAKYAISIDAIRPMVNNRGFVDLKKARHPLIDKNDVVPIDLVLGKDYQIIVITGPNTGGKTVSLKTLGLFTLMMQSGLFVPCQENSSLSIFREVFADIGDEQSIEQSLSTFSSHMNNIVHILKRAKRSHLVLFDELGAGTDPLEGAALAIAILEHLRYRRISCAATTHYSELKTYALNKKGVTNASLEFDVATLKPTYRLLIGIPGKSNAFAISKRLGLSDKIIKQAKRFMSNEDMDFEETIEKLQNFKTEAKKDRELASEYKKEVERQKEKLAQMKEKLEKQRQKMLSDARREAYDILFEAKKEADKLMKTSLSANNTNQSVLAKKEVNRLLGKNRDEIYKLEMTNQNQSVHSKKKLEIGDTVIVRDTNTKGTILEMIKDRDEVVLQAGLLKIKAKKSQLVYNDAQLEVTKNNPMMAKAITGVSLKTSDLKMEKDLRGYNVEDAIFEIDKYLDDCHLANLRQVMLIHGKGTGVLRNGIHKYLRHHRLVESIRLGEFGEGGSGVTVVTLK